jgi:hypothetical protein
MRQFCKFCYIVLLVYTTPFREKCSPFFTYQTHNYLDPQPDHQAELLEVVHCNGICTKYLGLASPI